MLVVVPVGVVGCVLVPVLVMPSCLPPAIVISPSLVGHPTGVVFTAVPRAGLSTCSFEVAMPITDLDLRIRSQGRELAGRAGGGGVVGQRVVGEHAARAMSGRTG